MYTSVYGVLALVSSLSEEDNEHDKYAVAVHLKNSLTVIGHIPREITRTCHFFIKSKGEITGEVSRRRQHGTATSGGLEVPCLLTFYHRDTRVLGKAMRLSPSDITRYFHFLQLPWEKGSVLAEGMGGYHP